MRTHALRFFDTTDYYSISEGLISVCLPLIRRKPLSDHVSNETVKDQELPQGPHTREPHDEEIQAGSQTHRHSCGFSVSFVEPSRPDRRHRGEFVELVGSDVPCVGVVVGADEEQQGRQDEEDTTNEH